ncbi:hypothetical protein BLL42_10220 [Pseudomonas frederiksbergensis]|uniref:Uncharacterized protein n=1 Tax=Pseudomonas frederiksbergensis TaxID=104087 RepID=A0A1J0EJT9_9PSED|nr:hypothetical protein [Pseudomonas frederiksbergensis]APC16084.1 hypothetical protein BLL42_10220 [Pseudomonas frederiksbergensis]
MSNEIINIIADRPFNEAVQDKYFERVEAQLTEVFARPRLRSFAKSGGVLAGRAAETIDASVVGPSLVVFEERLSEDDKQDALDSQAFAEAVVNKLPAETSQEQRYMAYNEALSAIGWVTESYTYKKYDSKKLTLTMNDALLQVLETVISAGSGNVLSLVAAGFDKLKGDKEALKIVDAGSKESSVVSFKAVPCIVAPGGGMAMVMGGLDVFSKDYDGDFLFFTFKTEGVHLFQAAGIRKFNKRAFDRKRQQVYNYIDQFGDGLFKKIAG